jgi:hypothetical protein
MTHIVSSPLLPSEKMVKKAESILETLEIDIKWHIINQDSPYKLIEISSTQYATMENIDFIIKIPFEDSFSESFIELQDHCLVSITISKELLEKLFEVRITTVSGKGPYVYIYRSHDKNDVNTSEDGLDFIKLINNCAGCRFTPVTPMPGVFYSQLYKIQTKTNIIQLTPNFRQIAKIPQSRFYGCTEEQLGQFCTDKEIKTNETFTNYTLPPGFDFVSRPKTAIYGIPVTTDEIMSSQEYCFVIKRFGYTKDDDINQGWIVKFDKYNKKFFTFNIVNGYLYCTGYKDRMNGAPETYKFPVTVFEKSILIQTHKIEHNWGQVYQLID